MNNPKKAYVWLPNFMNWRSKWRFWEKSSQKTNDKNNKLAVGFFAKVNRYSGCNRPRTAAAHEKKNITFIINASKIPHSREKNSSAFICKSFKRRKISSFIEHSPESLLFILLLTKVMNFYNKRCRPVISQTGANRFIFSKFSNSLRQRKLHTRIFCFHVRQERTIRANRSKTAKNSQPLSSKHIGPRQ